MKQERPILRNKMYLYLTEFFAGMSVMAVELGQAVCLLPILVPPRSSGPLSSEPLSPRLSVSLQWERPLPF